MLIHSGLSLERDRDAKKSKTTSSVSYSGSLETPSAGCKYTRLRVDHGCVVATDGHFVRVGSEDHEPGKSNDHGARIVAFYVKTIM